MKNPNLSWLFYREYFRGVDFEKDDDKRMEKAFEAKNRALYTFDLKDYAGATTYSGLPASHFVSFDLQTTYPGLLIGTGYSHDIAKIGAIKIGFYFDHTSGLPTLPGSSVKGILRSPFPNRDDMPVAELSSETEAGKEDTTSTTGKEKAINGLAAGKFAYLLHTLNEQGADKALCSESFVRQLESEIFEGLLPDGTQVPMSARFICHDAVVVGAEKGLMGPDFITPHGDSLTKEPNPIGLLKVMPGVTFRFTFQLPGEAAGQTSAVAKLGGSLLLRLLKQILLDFGIGAKTNVGYGHLLDPAAPPPVVPRQLAAAQATTSQAAPTIKVTELAQLADAEFFTGKLNYKKDLIMEAIVVKPGKPNMVQVYITPDNKPVVQLSGYRSELTAGATILALVKLKKDNKTINAVSFKGFKK